MAGKNPIKAGLIILILISLVLIFIAGNRHSLFQASLINWTPSASPSATGYTLGDIYLRLTANATTSAGNHSFSPNSSPVSTFYSLSEIYGVIPTIIPSTVKLGATYLGVTGTLVPSGGTASTSDLFFGKTALLNNNWDLATGTLNLSCNVSVFNGVANLVVDNYDGTGNGTNRWCMTDSGDAGESDIRSGRIAWVRGAAITGTLLTSCSPCAPPIPSGGTAQTSQVCTGQTFYGANQTDWNLQTGALTASASEIGVGNTYCSTVGTLLANLFSGTGQGFTGGSQANGGVDDYNFAGSPPADRYSGTWTSCAVGNSYCSTGLSSADAKDNSTGLVWSLPCNGFGCSSFSDSSPVGYSWDNSGLNNAPVMGDPKTASELCSSGSHSQSGWSLPHQKQIMQAYIDGSYGNLEAAAVLRQYWSATTQSSSTSKAWHTFLAEGSTGADDKTKTIYYVRCVR